MSRVALVTGAARGIGAATVRALLAQDWSVVAVDAGAPSIAGVDYPLATPEQLDAVVALDPDRVLGVVADVRDRAALASAAAAGVDRFGGLDAAVAAAGVIAGGRPLWETSDDQLTALWEVNVLGVWNTAAVCVPHLLAASDPAGSRFVAVSSAAGSRGLFHLAGYNASKHAVVGIVRGLAADLTGAGVTAVAVAPGSTRTDMLRATAGVYDLLDVEAFAASQGIGRLIAPEEIAATIAFCCSVEGAVLNGSEVHADGGFRG